MSRFQSEKQFKQCNQPVKQILKRYSIVVCCRLATEFFVIFCKVFFLFFVIFLLRLLQKFTNRFKTVDISVGKMYISPNPSSFKPLSFSPFIQFISLHSSISSFQSSPYSLQSPIHAPSSLHFTAYTLQFPASSLHLTVSTLTSQSSLSNPLPFSLYLTVSTLQSPPFSLHLTVSTLQSPPSSLPSLPPFSFL